MRCPAMFRFRIPLIHALVALSVAIFVIAAIPVSLSGQQASQSAPPPVPPAQSAPPPVRVSTRLVQVSVIVEEHGQPVTGLKQEDFQLFDQGQPQKIAFFSEHNSSVTATAAATPAPAPLPPDVFSNRIAEKPGVPTSVTVILLDLLNTYSADMAYARNQIVKFIEALQPQDRVALYGLSDDLYILHDFTHD